MNKTIAEKLKLKAQEIAKKFSHTDRAYNHSKESFEVYEIIPASEKTAFVILKKSTGKFGMAFLYYLKNPEDGYWQYFFPTESHIHGMRKIADILHKVEQYNFPINFKSK